MSQPIRSAILSADGAASANECDFYGVTVDGTGAVTLYDNASTAAGTKIWQGQGPISVNLGEKHIHCLNGIYCDLTGNVVTVFFN